MTLSSITAITQEGQPSGLSSFIRSGVMYVFWQAPVSDTGLQRLNWKPHTAADFTEVTPTLAQAFHNVTALYHPASDQVVVVWDDALAVSGYTDGSLSTARFNALTGALVSGPTVLFSGSQPKLSYRTTASSECSLYYVTLKNGGVYGRLSTDGGVTWQSGEPIITGQVSSSQRIEVVPYDSEHVAIAQLGSDARPMTEIGMLQRTRPLSSIINTGGNGASGHILDANTLALWRLDEAGTTWADATGNYPLTQTGSPTSVVGRVNNARRFTASGQYATNPADATARSQIIDGEFTVEFWFYASTAEWATSPVQSLLISLSGDQVGGPTQNTLFGVQIHKATRQFQTFGQKDSNVYTAFGPGTLIVPLDRWNHLAWRSISDGSGTFTWTHFLDGVLAGTETLVQASNNGGSAQWLLGSGLNFGIAPHGVLDDIRISKVPRTNAEILASAQRSPVRLHVGEPSKFDNTTLIDNLRGGLVASTDGSKLYHLDGVVQGTSDTVGAVARITITGTALAVTSSAGPAVGANGDDFVSLTLDQAGVPTLGALNVDLPGASFAGALDVSSTHGYVAEYADNSGVLGQLIVVDLTSGTTATVFTGVTGVRAVAVANFLTPKLIFVASTESGFERLRVYEENALTPTLLLNTKLTSRANAITVAPSPGDPTGALVYVSCVDRLNIYRYTNASLPAQLVDSVSLPGGGSFFQSQLAANGNVVVAAGNAGVLVLDANGGIIAQTAVSGKPVLAWVPSKVYALNDLVKPRSTSPFARSRMYFKASTAGTSGTAEPSWQLTGTILDSGAQWQPVGLLDGWAVGIALDETAKKIYAVGSVGGVLGTDGRVWVISAAGLI